MKMKMEDITMKIGFTREEITDTDRLQVGEKDGNMYDHLLENPLQIFTSKELAEKLDIDVEMLTNMDESQMRFYESVELEDWKTEFWRKHPVWNIYCSSLGRLYREKFEGNDGKTYGGYLLNVSYNGGGYLVTSINVEGKVKPLLVSRTILEAFTCLNKSMECDHYNNVRHDNRLVNLQWLDRKANVQKAKGLSRKFTKYHILGMYILRSQGYKYREIAEKFGTNKPLVDAIFQERTYKDVIDELRQDGYIK